MTCLRSQFSNTSLVAVRAAFIAASSVGSSGGSRVASGCFPLFIALIHS